MNINQEEQSLRKLSSDFGITPKELLCLAFWHYGYSAKESAVYLDNSPRTIEVHRGNVFNRFKPIDKEGVKRYLIENEYSKSLEVMVRSVFTKTKTT